MLIGHFTPAWLPAKHWIYQVGQHGVAIFFVLSGFLITNLLLREQEETGTVNLGRFYLRRAFRLMPCAWGFLGMLLLISHWAPALFAPKEMVASLFFFRNYVDLDFAHPITGHFWSLLIEEQFYLFWPSLLLLLDLRRGRWFAIAAAAAIEAVTKLANRPDAGTFR